jgi:hypothetical protein
MRKSAALEGLLAIPNNGPWRFRNALDIYCGDAIVLAQIRAAIQSNVLFEPFAQARLFWNQYNCVEMQAIVDRQIRQAFNAMARTRKIRLAN